MKVRVLAFGQRMPSWVEEGIDEYAKRIPQALRPQVVELALSKRGSTKALSKIRLEEDERMLAALKSREFVVALDQQGKNWTTEQLASKLQGWQQVGDDVVLLIGGPEGLGDKCLQRANLRWSLSGLTLPHPMVRIVLMEQFYRAWSIQTGHPYHK